MDHKLIGKKEEEGLNSIQDETQKQQISITKARNRPQEHSYLMNELANIGTLT